MNAWLHALFNLMLVGDTCTWHGTTYEGTGKDATLLPCGEPTVGAGLFCDPGHRSCGYFSLCDRHSRSHETENWTEVK